MELTKIWLAVDIDGNITAGSTTPPELIPVFPGDNLPNYTYTFEVTNEIINDLWRYKVVNGKLVVK